MVLAMDCPVRSACNPFAAQEAELGKPVPSLKVISGAVIYIVPSVLDRNANTIMLATSSCSDEAAVPTFQFPWRKKALDILDPDLL
jgi:hypothetical protein